MSHASQQEEGIQTNDDDDDDNDNDDDYNDDYVTFRVCDVLTLLLITTREEVRSHDM